VAGFHLEVWVFLTRLHREQHIVEFAEANGDKAPALLYDDPTWKFKYRDGRGGEAYSNLIPRRDLWYHIVVAIDRWNQGRLFVNGSLESEFTRQHVPQQRAASSTSKPRIRSTRSRSGRWARSGTRTGQGEEGRLPSCLDLRGLRRPEVHPQPESYWGHVNPVGPRGVYDEAKRYVESMAMAYHRVHEVPVKIVRIFNTFGPRLRRADGRAVPNFISQAFLGHPLTVYGDGSQTRSLCYVVDLVEGIWQLLGADFFGPMNIGNPEEVKILELAERVSSLVGNRSEIVFAEPPEDDPEVRCPDISLARELLGWEPTVSYPRVVATLVDVPHP
jgi:hypothetical protein